MSYNGWKNRQTWNVNLWLSNEESLYHEARRIAQGPKPATRLREYCEEIWPDGVTPDGDSLKGVEWGAVAKGFRD